MVSEHERLSPGASYDASKCSHLIQVIKKRNIFMSKPESPAPPPPQTHLPYTNSNTQTLKAAKCQLGSGAASS